MCLYVLMCFIVLSCSTLTLARWSIQGALLVHVVNVLVFIFLVPMGLSAILRVPKRIMFEFPKLVPNLPCSTFDLSTWGRVRGRKELSLFEVFQRPQWLSKIHGLSVNVIRQRHQLVPRGRTLKADHLPGVHTSKDC